MSLVDETRENLEVPETWGLRSDTGVGQSTQKERHARSWKKECLILGVTIMHTQPRRAFLVKLTRTVYLGYILHKTRIVFSFF